MAINTRLVDRYVARLRHRGQALAQQAATVVTLLRTSPVDLRTLLGPVLVMAQGVARGQVEVLAWVMSDDTFKNQKLDFQSYVAQQAVLWTDLWSALSNISFASRLPSIDGLADSTPAANALGANQRGVAIGTALESVVNVAAASGLGFETFWSQTATGRAALGRLLAMDVTLTRVYDFDVLSEAMSVLAELVPIAPDSLATIRKIEAARPRQVIEPKAGTAVAFTVTQGMNLAALAQGALGQADRWRDIAAYNNLRYPYVSDRLLDQYGDPQGTVALAVAPTQGSRTVEFISAEGLYPDQRLHLDSVDSNEIVTILSVEGNVVTLVAPLVSAYPVNADVTIYAPAYDVIGRVFKTGDTILVPATAEDAQPIAIIQGSATGSSEELYGRDVLVTERGSLLTENGDLALVAGVPNLTQALQNRFRTPKGSLPYHPTYGFLLDQFIGYRHDSFFNFLAVVEGQQTVLRDPRIERVENFSADAQADTLTMAFDVTTKNQQLFPAVVATPIKG